MVGHALWFEKWSNNVYEDDGLYPTTFHQYFCSGVSGCHPHIQQDLGRTLVAYSAGFAHPKVAKSICQLGKFSFGMYKVHYLGYIIDQHGIHVDLANIQVICDWPAPITLTELRSFLGLSNF